MDSGKEFIRSKRSADLRVINRVNARSILNLMTRQYWREDIKMINAINIPSDNPEHTSVYKYSLGGLDQIIPQVYECHRKELFNFNVYYGDSIWGTEEERCQFVLDNIILPFLLEKGVAEFSQDINGLAISDISKLRALYKIN